MTVAELDQVLDRISRDAEADKAPVVVDIFPTDGSAGLQIGVGHPQRSFVFHVSYGFGTDPTVAPWPQTIEFDYAGEPTDYQPEETRVAPGAARAAAREYITTRQRPTCLEWPS